MRSEVRPYARERIVRRQAAELPPECVRAVARMRPSDRATHRTARQNVIECSPDCARTSTRCIRTAAPCARIPARMRPHVHANPKGRTIRTNGHRNASKCTEGQSRAYGRMRPKVPAMRPNSHQNAHECSPDRARTFARCARIDARRAIMFSRMHLNARPNAPDRSRDALEHSRDAPECLHECARMFSRLLQNHRLNAPESSCLCVC